MSESQGNIFVHRPIVAIVIAIVIVVVGIASMVGLPIEQYPSLTPPVDADAAVLRIHSPALTR